MVASDGGQHLKKTKYLSIKKYEHHSIAFNVKFHEVLAYLQNQKNNLKFPDKTIKNTKHV